MKHKVEYYSTSGSPSDNIFIGIFDTLELAKIAKSDFIKEYMGESKEEWCELNDCQEDEYYEELECYENSTLITDIN